MLTRLRNKAIGAYLWIDKSKDEGFGVLLGFLLPIPRRRSVTAKHVTFNRLDNRESGALPIAFVMKGGRAKAVTAPLEKQDPRISSVSEK